VDSVEANDVAIAIVEHQQRHINWQLIVSVSDETSFSGKTTANLKF